MQTETKLFAKYQDFLYSTVKTLEVKDEKDAAQKADSHVLRFKTYEQTYLEMEDEILEGKPKNYSSLIYPNVERVLNVDEVIALREAELAAVKSRELKEEFSNTDGLNVLLDVAEDLLEHGDSEPLCYIRRPGHGCAFIRLQEDEKAYNAQGQQLFPAPAADVAPANTRDR